MCMHASAEIHSRSASLLQQRGTAADWCASGCGPPAAPGGSALAGSLQPLRGAGAGVQRGLCYRAGRQRRGRLRRRWRRRGRRRRREVEVAIGRGRRAQADAARQAKHWQLCEGPQQVQRGRRRRGRLGMRGQHARREHHTPAGNHAARVGPPAPMRRAQAARAHLHTGAVLLIVPWNEAARFRWRWLVFICMWGERCMHEHFHHGIELRVCTQCSSVHSKLLHCMSLNLACVVRDEAYAQLQAHCMILPNTSLPERKFLRSLPRHALHASSYA